ncbi:hypothetical protein PUN28_019539 [Cardiocondyla obscurior]|uniref:Transmembrane protein n=1 Tax=Cardiocondyla obscurior TaxID=286306 RepID=A0AAW2ECX5_9HYME
MKYLRKTPARKRKRIYFNLLTFIPRVNNDRTTIAQIYHLTISISVKSEKIMSCYFFRETKFFFFFFLFKIDYVIKSIHIVHKQIIKIPLLQTHILISKRHFYFHILLLLDTYISLLFQIFFSPYRTCFFFFPSRISVHVKKYNRIEKS